MRHNYGKMHRDALEGNNQLHISKKTKISRSRELVLICTGLQLSKIDITLLYIFFSAIEPLSRFTVLKLEFIYCYINKSRSICKLTCYSCSKLHFAFAGIRVFFFCLIFYQLNYALILLSWTLHILTITSTIKESQAKYLEVQTNYCTSKIPFRFAWPIQKTGHNTMNQRRLSRFQLILILFPILNLFLLLINLAIGFWHVFIGL